MNAPTSQTAEPILIGCVILNNSLLDVAISSGLTAKHFSSQAYADIFTKCVQIRARNEVVDLTSLTLEQANIVNVMSCENMAPSEIYFNEALTQVIDAYAARIIQGIAIEIKASSGDREVIANHVERMVSALETKHEKRRTLEQIGQEVEEVAVAKINRIHDPRVAVEWPFAKANTVFSPIMPHELVGVAARPKQGKSSLTLQILGHNVRRGLKGVYFTLETSDTASFSLVAGQLARMPLRALDVAPKQSQQAYLDTIRKLKTAKNLLIIDKDMSISAIESRCRLLAASFKPDFVVIDHLHQIQTDQGRSNYEKLTDISLRLVELRKRLGCAVIIAIQLNRGSENEERPPRSADARDSGAIEAAVHRMVLIHRPKTDFNDVQQIGPEVESRSLFDCYLMQELNRDGPCGNIRARFNAPLSLFDEYTK